MRPEEVRLGMRVRVRADHRLVHLRGREGTITNRWGSPNYVAVDVLLDDGRSQMLWPHELEEIE